MYHFDNKCCYRSTMDVRRIPTKTGSLKFRDKRASIENLLVSGWNAGIRIGDVENSPSYDKSKTVDSRSPTEINRKKNKIPTHS